MEQPAVNPGWRKSSFSNNGGANCVEVGSVPWRKATYSNNGGADCVEAGHVPGAVLVRDTTDRDGAVLTVPADAWRRFTATLR